MVGLTELLIPLKLSLVANVELVLNRICINVIGLLVAMCWVLRNPAPSLTISFGPGIVPAPPRLTAVIDSINPVWIPAGSPDQVLTIFGENFSSDLNPRYEGPAGNSDLLEKITYVNDATITGVIPAYNLAQPVDFKVYLMNRNTGQKSNVVTFSVK